MPRTTVVTRRRGAYIYDAGLSIDADGCPRAYGPPGCPIEPLDDLICAGRPGHWWGLACDENGQPYVQGPDDPAPGYYVSTTALYDRTKPASSPRRYVDAATVPYVVIPPELHARGLRMGELSWVIYGTAHAGAIVADIGPSQHFGEASIALARELGIPSSPQHGGVGAGVRYIIFEHSAAVPPWPRNVLEFQAEARARYEAWQSP